MKFLPRQLFALLVVCVFLAGCSTDEQIDESTSLPPDNRPAAASEKPTPPGPAVQKVTPENKTPEAKADKAAPADKPTEKAAENKADKKPAAPLAKSYQKAESGVGQKGHYKKGLVTTPVATFFRAQERIAFEIQIPQAMQLFKAMENRPPKDQKEFMDRIIKEHRIQLPELPAGSRYFYDPKTEELLVEQGQPEQTGK